MVFEVGQLLEKIRKENPLIHHITNIVVANFTANGTIAVGASPVMAYAVDEVEEMVSKSRALVLNLGTLNPAVVDSMIKAGKKANALGVPVILDPVGVGATSYRKKVAEQILQEIQVSILRGNGAELATIVGEEWISKGVDAKEQGGNLKEITEKAAKRFHLVAAGTGKIDYVSDGYRTAAIANGDPLLTKVTGTGCLATSIIGAFAAVSEDVFIGTSSALAYYGSAAQLAAMEAKGPGSFQEALLDTMYNLTSEQADQMARITIVK
ncbi:hydroxyethylthiazole kinase [Microaerobacter geothermalis]|uniref:hydroxyethylthiazole kinase n=1 Tax=Microaerobacter geothermalis TaxID=674972 RepID=UPI001F384F50|nr:hydroxyethylthiazole kinase [Microaerobacter geothermalis]MCF6093655.1 hydroxyethylthiazole kinase [Microaerobacter geothermalis]